MTGSRNEAGEPATVLVVGAGAGGMMAAGRAGEGGAPVLLLEKMDAPGRKVLISGKTRCNLTNQKPLEDFIGMYGRNGRFLYRAFRAFFRDDLLALLKRYGVETKIERGGRIFPLSDRSGDVVKALRQYAASHGVELKTRSRVEGIIVRNGRVQGVRTDSGAIPGRAVILATGGATYPGTGSTGDGYAMARKVGHTIIPVRPALVPLVVEETKRARSMQGVSLRNIRLTAFRGPSEEIDDALVPHEEAGRGILGRQARSPVIESRRGEMMITHFGIGGPVTLLMSLAVVDALAEGPVSVAIDLKPALGREQLQARVQRDLDRFGKRRYGRILEGFLPRKMIGPFVDMTGIPADKPTHQISAAERERIVRTLKSVRFNIRGPLPLSSAIVTAGGIALDEIDPRTMASCLVRGLYCCGEVLDIDADTGGYNLQAAFSTGYLAGAQAAVYVKAGQDGPGQAVP
jgi:predicted flavoprotein YhiN